MAHGRSDTTDTHDGSSEEGEGDATPNPAHCHAVWLVSLGSDEGGQPLVSKWLVGQFFSKLRHHYALTTRFPGIASVFKDLDN